MFYNSLHIYMYICHRLAALNRTIRKAQANVNNWTNGYQRVHMGILTNAEGNFHERT